MKKLTCLGLSVAMALTLLAGCGGGETSTTGSQTGSAGTSQSAVSSGANEVLSGTVSTNGSTSMEKVILTLNEQFNINNPDVKVSYDPTGSSTGIEAVKNGTTDIGLSSRTLKEEETAE